MSKVKVPTSDAETVTSIPPMQQAEGKTGTQKHVFWKVNALSQVNTPFHSAVLAFSYFHSLWPAVTAAPFIIYLVA